VHGVHDPLVPVCADPVPEETPETALNPVEPELELVEPELEVSELELVEPESEVLPEAAVEPAVVVP
jgi:hypothetical protein